VGKQWSGGEARVPPACRGGGRGAGCLTMLDSRIAGLGGLGRSARPSMMALATSISLRLLLREWVRSISKAAPSSTSWRTIRMPFARPARDVRTRLPGSGTRRAAKNDVDGALQLVGFAVGDVGEDAALGRLVDEVAVIGLEDRDHRAGCGTHDPFYQVKRMRAALTKPDQSHVGKIDLRSNERRLSPRTLDSP
jgi:hypothetical protein